MDFDHLGGFDLRYETLANAKRFSFHRHGPLAKDLDLQVRHGGFEEQSLSVEPQIPLQDIHHQEVKKQSFFEALFTVWKHVNIMYMYK